MSFTVSVGETSLLVTVSPETSVAVVASGGIGPAGFLTAPGTATNAFGTFQLVPGPGITMSTSAGVFLLSGYSTTEIQNLSPVSSVAGRTGAIELAAADVTAGTFDIARIPTIAYTALSGVPSTFAPEAHTHSTSDIVSFASAAAAAAPVQSVNSQTGVVTLAAIDVTAAASSHTHDAADIASGVLNIDRIPVIGYTALSGVPTAFEPSVHSHVAADVTDFAAEVAAIGNVVSVAGLTGIVQIVAGDNVTVSTAGSTITIAGGAGGGGGASLSDDTPLPLGVAAAGTGTAAARSDHVHLLPTIGDLTAASATHTHDASDITTGTLSIDRIPVIGYTALSGVPTTFTPASHTHDASDVTSGTFDVSRLPTIGYTALSGVPTSFTPATHTHDASDVTTGVFSIARIPTIGYTALSGVPLRLRWTSQTLTADAHDHTVGDYEVVRFSMTTANSLTGFSGGTEGKSHRVVNVAADTLTFRHQSTSSSASNRLLIATGLDHSIGQDEQAEFLYDPVDERWRMTPCCGGTATY